MNLSTISEFWWVNTEVDLISDGQSFPMPNMTNTSFVHRYYGPQYVYTLPDAFPLSSIRNFSVHMEYNNTNPAFYGVVHVGFLDESYDRVLLAKIDDWMRYELRGGCRWDYYIRNSSIHTHTLDNERAYNYGMGFSQHVLEYVNMTWSSWFESSNGLNGSIPAYGPMPARNGTIIPIEEAETARGIKYLVLMFGGYYKFQDNPLPPFRVHDIYLEYEVGGEIDTTLPSLNSPQDLVYQVGQTGNSIEWNSSDNHPYRYWVIDYKYSYSFSGSNRNQGLWNGSPFTLSVDGLEVGNRTFLLVLQDKAGFIVWDRVTVMVIEHPLISFIRANAVIIAIPTFFFIVYAICRWTETQPDRRQKRYPINQTRSQPPLR